ncbi:uncharacterized protein PFL1_00723 [Pseudozyma flocculosa PF-1]|uniref:Uncharacterized protein n=1 Tax=Pseudozyma flocculosa TaxID=84751 RepID=A0A5C3F3C0_9BASI|nr:uncharacterized protein PFL1_00723 [Pseudozyma flocculosa PF-1]EPQ31388.1 hypothetical protein PFL1_00723 [Pseudozyma flocculosa PF-1]SPO38832.1 uncharacterized protein PSFLO_04311 [Pseudozyma flocculosa]
MFATRLVRFTAGRAVRASNASTSVATLAPRLKASTNVTGVDVHPSPLSALAETYTKTLSLLSSLPESSVYRQSTAALTQHHLDVVQRALDAQRGHENDAQKIEDLIRETEEQLEWPYVEDGLRQAKTELGLVANMLEWKAWEPLEHPPPPNQWHYFSMAEEAGEGGEDQNVDGGKQ